VTNVDGTGRPTGFRRRVRLRRRVPTSVEEVHRRQGPGQIRVARPRQRGAGPFLTRGVNQVGRQVDGIVVVVARRLRREHRGQVRRRQVDGLAVMVTARTMMVVAGLGLEQLVCVEVRTEVVPGGQFARVAVAVRRRLDQQAARQQEGHDSAVHGFLIGPASTFNLAIPTRATTPAYPNVPVEVGAIT
jgi:hypothetical protein